MYMTETGEERGCGLHEPRRNRYFHGQLLDVYQFELETAYFNDKRRLLNRLVTGFGVVCGLDVHPAEGREDAIVITPGLALDRHGREIVVETGTRPIPIPAALVEGRKRGYGLQPGKLYDIELEDPGQAERKPWEEPREQQGEEDDEDCHDDRYVHVVLCYHECLAEPALVMSGDCCEPEPCQPGVIRERYKVVFRKGRLDCPRPDLLIPDVISDGRLDYPALAKWISGPCPECPEDPCIPLANIRIDRDEDKRHCRAGDIDISVRPIVYTNDLLYQLLLSLMTEAPRYRRDK